MASLKPSNARARLRNGAPANGGEILGREWLRAERRIAGVAGEREVHFRRSASERFRSGGVSRHRIDRLWKRHADHIRERIRHGIRRRSASGDRFEESADLIGRMAPAVGLALDQLLQHRDGHRLLRGRPVFQGAGNRRYSRIADALGQLTADLEVGVDAGLQASEQLEDQSIPVDQGRVALLAGQPADVERAVAAGTRKSAGLHRHQRAAPRADVLLLLEHLEQRAAEAVVEPRVEEHALARAGHPRQHRVAENALRRRARRRPRKSPAAGNSCPARHPRS